MRLAALAACAAACGSSSPPAQPAGPPAQLVPAPAGATDDVVAHVNGRPVYGSCVAAQAAAHAQSAKAALAECIDFELLAQAAETRGLALDHDVAYATKTALVSKLLASVFEDGITSPSDLGSDWPMFKHLNDWHYKHEEYRGSTYVRVPLPKDAPAADEAQAHALADKVAAALAHETGMLPPHVRELASSVTGPLVECLPETKVVCYGDVPVYRVTGLEEHYGTALFALPEPGRATAAVRTQWGWDVIVWTNTMAATSASDAEVDAKLLTEYKAKNFGAWVRSLERAMNLHVLVEPTAEASLGTLQ